MSAYDLYKKKVYSDLSNSELDELRAKETAIINFYDYSGLGISTIYKNDNAFEELQVAIYGGNKHEKAGGYKLLLSYPYDEIKFSIGDYIHWKYGDESTIWLLSTLDKQYKFNIKGRIVQCNHLLKWRDSDSLVQQNYCVIQQSKSLASDVEETTVLNLPQNQRRIFIQENTNTSKLMLNQRIIFNDSPWEIVVIDKTGDSGKGILTLVVQETTVDLSGDDLINEIPSEQKKEEESEGMLW